MDLFGPTRSMSLSGKKYGYVLVDDFSRYTWVFFLTHKYETFSEFQVFYKKIEQDEKFKISNIQSDHGGEFQNNEFDQFCRTQGINQKFSSPRTLEQNGVVERRNRTLVEMARTMLIESNLPRKFWAEAINTSCYIINKAMVRNSSKKTSYEMFKGKKPSLAHFRVFRTKCFIHINKKILINLKQKVNQESFLVILRPLELTEYIIWKMIL